MPLSEELAPFVREHYWDLSFSEMADACDCGTSTIQRAANYADLPKKTDANRLEHEYGVPLPWLLDTLHNTLMKSVNQMSKDLGVSRRSIMRWMDEDYDIPRRGRSDAERVKWDQMSDAEREAQVAAAHEASRKPYAHFHTSTRGYEAWRTVFNGDISTVKHHRLLATLCVDDINELDGKHVHHKNKIPWDNRMSNLEVLSEDEHMRRHVIERRDPDTGQFA